MISDIILTNFLSYREAHLKVAPGQLNVVIGRNESDYSDSNGSGKSALLKALLWALYGQYPGQENADSVVNNQAKKGTRVQVFFAKHDVRYVVERYRKHPEEKSNVYLWVGNQRFAGDVKDVQQQIVDAIGLDYDVFLATLVFTGEREDEFAGGTDKEQKRVLNALLPLAFEAAFDRAAVKYADAQRALEANQKALEKLEWDLQANEQASKQAADSGVVWARERETKLTALKAEIIAVDDQLVALKEALPKWEAADQQWQVTLDSQRPARERLLAEEHKLDAEKTDALQKNRDWRAAKAAADQARKTLAEQATTHAHETGKLQEEIRALQDGGNDHCPTCGQVVQHEARARTLARLNELLAEQTTKQQAERTKWDDHLKAMEHRCSTLFDDEALSQKLCELDPKIKAVADQLTYLDQQEQTWRPQYNQHVQDFTKLRSNLARVQAEARSKVEYQERLLAETDPYQAQRARLWAEQGTLKTRGITLADNTERLAADLRKWEAVKLMFSGGKGGLHHFVFEQLLPEMTATAQMFLNFFSANTLKVAFKSHRMSGKKVVEGFFVDASRGDVEGYGNLSRGEQRRVNVAISLTLYLMAAKHVFNPGILFLDEVADSLDTTGKQSIVELLEHFCTQYSAAAVLLTNDREFMATVQSGYECTMRNGVSTLATISES